MRMNKIEDVMYLARMNLFFTDAENNLHDWRDAEVVSISHNIVTLDVSFDDNVRYDEISYTLDELESFCHELCEKHFEAVKSCMA